MDRDGAMTPCGELDRQGRTAHPVGRRFAAPRPGSRCSPRHRMAVHVAAAPSSIDDPSRARMHFHASRCPVDFRHPARVTPAQIATNTRSVFDASRNSECAVHTRLQIPSSFFDSREKRLGFAHRN